MKLHLLCATLGMWLSAHAFAQIVDPLPASGKNPKPVDKKPAEARYQFAMDAKPWPQVLQWLSETSGKAIVQNSPGPAGGLTFIGPKGKTYALSEIVDILSESLLSKKYHLIHGEKAFHLLAADEKIDPALVPRVSVDELPRRGKNEMVSLVLRLKHLNSDELAPELKKILGTHGEIIPISVGNSLLICDLAGKLRDIVGVIREIEDVEGPSGQSYSYVCQYIPASKAKSVLEQFFGVSVKGKRVLITIDEESNSIHVNGSNQAYAQAKAVLAKVDVPPPSGQKYVVPRPILKSYAAPDGKAEALAKLFQEIYGKGPNTKIVALSPNEIVVYGIVDVHAAVAMGLESLKSPLAMEVIPLGNLEAAKVTDMLRSLFGSKGPHFAVQADLNVLVVRGSQAQIAEVRTVLAHTQQQPGNVRVINLDKGSAQSLAEELQKAMKNLRSNPIEIIQPHIEPPPAAKDDPGPKKSSGFPGTKKKEQLKKEPPKQEESKLPGNPKVPVRIIAFGNRVVISSDDREALALAGELARLIIGTVPTDFEIIRVRNAKAAEMAKVLNEAFNDGETVGRLRIVADPGSNSLLVKAGPLDMHSVRKLLARLDIEDSAEASSPAPRVSVLRLKNVVAADLVKTLQELYGNDKSLNLTADSRSNSIIVRASPVRTEEVAAMIIRLDQE